jgi:hypothetical protein
MKTGTNTMPRDAITSLHFINHTVIIINMAILRTTQVWETLTSLPAQDPERVYDNIIAC